MKKIDSIFIGPAQAKWWKYGIARRIVSLRMRYSFLRKIPKFDDHVTDRALDVTMGSREIEVIENDE